MGWALLGGSGRPTHPEGGSVSHLLGPHRSRAPTSNASTREGLLEHTADGMLTLPFRLLMSGCWQEC